MLYLFQGLPACCPADAVVASGASLVTISTLETILLTVITEAISRILSTAVEKRDFASKPLNASILGFYGVGGHNCCHPI